MRLAKYLGHSAASVETTLVKGRKLIIVQRYDRVIHQDGSVQRLHQEDFCQATGALPDKITIYRGPLERMCGTNSDRLADEVTRTVWHEIAHHFGISDQRLVEIDRY